MLWFIYHSYQSSRSPAKEPYNTAKEPYNTSKEPYNTAKEPYNAYQSSLTSEMTVCFIPRHACVRAGEWGMGVDEMLRGYSIQFVLRY